MSINKATMTTIWNAIELLREPLGHDEIWKQASADFSENVQSLLEEQVDNHVLTPEQAETLLGEWWELEAHYELEAVHGWFQRSHIDCPYRDLVNASNAYWNVLKPLMEGAIKPAKAHVKKPAKATSKATSKTNVKTPTITYKWCGGTESDYE